MRVVMCPDCAGVNLYRHERTPMMSGLKPRAVSFECVCCDHEFPAESARFMAMPSKQDFVRAIDWVQEHATPPLGANPVAVTVTLILRWAELAAARLEGEK